MSVFPTPGHLASWATLTPRTIQSGAKNGHGGTGKGNRWLKAALGEAAVSASRTKTFLGARYRRIARHAPKKKAVVAVARNILEIAYVLTADPDARFHDLGVDWHERHVNHTRKTRQHVRELEHLGYTVTLAPSSLIHPPPSPSPVKDPAMQPARKGPDFPFSILLACETRLALSAPGRRGHIENGKPNIAG